MDCIENALKSTGWNLARVKLLARFLTALVVCRSVCLTRVANALEGDAQTASHDKRLQRFLRGFDLNCVAVARLMLRWLQTGIGLKAPYILSLDRTNWKFGQTHINVLMIAIVHNGVAFPLLWSLLEKAGNSSVEERQSLLECYCEAFGKNSISYLTADREFGGKAFLSWLKGQKIGFVIRLRGNIRIANSRGVMQAGQDLFASGRVGVAKRLGPRQVFGKTDTIPLFVSGMRLADDYLIVASNRDPNLSDPIAEYGNRWGIETLFGSLKRRGFDLEGTHLRDSERLSRLLSVLALAFCWAYLCGAWLFEKKPWKSKKHGRLTVSLFRRGLDHLQRLLMPICGRMQPQGFAKAIQFLSCT
jgi:hypothetical protein